MSFAFDPPQVLVTDRFLVRPQRLVDNEADYEAVMESVEWLRRWSASEWPADDFTPDDNLDDLRGHIDEHAAREAFGFTIATPDEAQVLGSLYVQRLAETLDEYDAPHPVRAVLRGAELRGDLWIRSSRLADLLAPVVVAVHGWLTERWPAGGVAWGARRDCPELEDAYIAAGLELRARLVHPDSGRICLLFA